jgi:hypothetical protein
MNTSNQIKLLKEVSDILESYGKYKSQVSDLRKLAKSLDSPDPVRPTDFVVQALICSDDENISDHVEAVHWLETMTDDDLEFLCQDPGANETTDGLYWALDGEIGDDPWGFHVAARLGRYLSAINESGTKDTMGFSVRLDEIDLQAWVKKNRPEAWKRYQGEEA